MELETTLLSRFVSAHPAQASRILEAMPTSEAADALAALPVDASSSLLPYLVPLSAARLLALLDPERAARELSATRRDTAAAILRAMQQAPRSTVLASLQPAARSALAPLLRYSEGTAGALMDPEVLSVVETVSAGEALERLRASSQHALYYVYVVDDDQKLVGVVNIRELMGARPDELLALQATREVESLSARARSDSIVAHPGWKRFHALPVVDSNGRFLGVIRYESVRELEGRLLEMGVEDQGAETAAALGELYALGLRGLFEWGAATLLGSAEADRRRR